MKSLTYISHAALDLTAEQLEEIHRTARDLNAIDGITGLLVFNGTRFLQVIEGSETAVNDLVARLRRDTRHSGVEIRDERTIQERSFPDWSMELVQVEGTYLDARSAIDERIPADVDPQIRDCVHRMTESISGVVRV
ncbi:BLUF domain-containing protein [Sphingomonas sinipercae]|uniref:BLUF domain-containing protein n=1 Tax=Sphingomonas sinipercae TaxID=2714944 RepID=A0A6G7ZPC2_9SPHN|nr:BLUF domain-containing protein [Sphingomonas sinipercae]QIL02772.1 BLUF domain-containing protein [Sphingomonas sinipercae]